MHSLSLSTKLLLLTIAFVMLAEVLIFFVSVGREQQAFLTNKLEDGHLAILALEAAEDGMVSPEMTGELLRQVDAVLVSQKAENGANLVLRQAPPEGISRTVDLRELNPVSLIFSATETLTMLPDGNLMLLIGYSPKGDNLLMNVVFRQDQLIASLQDFAARVFIVSLFISVVTGVLIYISLNRLIVRPVRKLTEAIENFAAAPEDQHRQIAPSPSADELGIAQTRLAEMQQTVRGALHQKQRLAAIGIGVTKLTHDLRNVMATTLLMSDSLEMSKDPTVRKVAPKLTAEIERAERLCMATVEFARRGPVQLKTAALPLKLMLDDLQDMGTGLEITVTGDSQAMVLADRDQFTRVLANLLINARQMGATAICLDASADPGTVRLDVTDNGPGLPPRARDNLFQPFAGSARKGGTGLGLAIAKDVMRAHGGDISLRNTGVGGTCFCLTLPAAGDGSG